MSFPYLIDPPQRLVTVTMPATVHGSDVLATIQAMYDDPEWRSGFNTLWDGSGIAGMLLEKDDLPSIVALQRAFGDVAGPGHDVFIASRMLDEAMARAYVAMMKNPVRQVHVCRSRAEAMRILSPSNAGVKK